MSLHTAILSAHLAELRKHKRYADNAFAQLRDDEFFVRLNPEQCSIYVYVKHLSGNMKSRFTDFLTTDGEKPWRDRDSEFVEEVIPRPQVLQLWEAGWAAVFSAIEPLQESDLQRTVTIRNEPHTVALAITRQLAHYAYHVGQIVLLAKHFVTQRGDPWTYSTIPPGGSKEFNRKMGI